MMTDGRLRLIKSKYRRNVEDRRHVGELIAEVERLRGVLEAIGITASATGTEEGEA